MEAIHELGTEIIERLEQNGSDLAHQHAFDFFFYFHSVEHAEAVAARLGNAGFATEILRGEEPRWLCLASKTVVPDEEAFNYYGKWFETLAHEHEGEFDGWETKVSA
jgi:hypothetical protein